MPNENDDLPEAPAKGKKKPPAAASPPPAVPPPPPPPEAKKYKHTSRLIALATQAGYTLEDIETTDAATLWEEIDRLQAMHARNRPAPPPPKVEKTEPADEDEEFLKELAATDVDPKYVSFLRRQHSRTKAAEAKAAKADELEKKFGEQTRQQQFDAIDAGFIKLSENPGFAAVIGAGYASETTDPGHRGWRQAIAGNAGLQDGDTLATITHKIIQTGSKMLAGKAAPPSPPVAPPPPPAKKPPVQDPVTGRFTAEDFASASLPNAGDRRAERNGLTGAAVLHEHLREIGDERGQREFVDDSNDDLPE